MADKPLGIGIPSISIPGFNPMGQVTQQEGVMAVGNPEQAFNQADILAGAAGETEDLGLRGSIRDNAREGTLQETLDKIQAPLRLLVLMVVLVLFHQKICKKFKKE
jgi:hypothetical protein